MSNKTSDYYYGFRNNGLLTGISYQVRKRIYDFFYERFGTARSIADVGVTAESVSPESNILEALFPHKDRITAIGIEDAGFLESMYPGMKFIQVQPNQPLPFETNTFDVVYSHAVIEHIVDEKARKFFLEELIRIGKSAFITTPNKFFIVDPHTMTPFIHFLLPRLYYWLLDKKILNQFFNSSNLHLLSYADLQNLALGIPGISYEIQRIKFLGMTSNLILLIKKSDPC